MKLLKRRNGALQLRWGSDMNKTDRYYVVVSWNGIRWIFPKDGSSFMTIKELVDIDNGKVPEKWKEK